MFFKTKIVAKIPTGVHGKSAVSKFLGNKLTKISIRFRKMLLTRTFRKSKLNLKSDRVNLVATASPIECLLYLPNVRAIQNKLGPERLTRLGNSNVLRLPVPVLK